jgi:uncharacterized damage-inducible protein DinB
MAHTIQLPTIRTSFAYSDWARDKLLNAASSLSDAQLDQKFEIGLGSIRQTLYHNYEAERVWLERWRGVSTPFYPDAGGISIPQLWSQCRTVERERNRFLEEKTNGDLLRPVSYVNILGESYTFPLGKLTLHVSNHGTQHRAQALNMFRRLGIRVDDVDFLYMRIEQAAAKPPALDIDTLRTYTAFGDWAMDRMFEAATPISELDLNREFEMGYGTLGRTLTHVMNAEAEWLASWKAPIGEPAPPWEDHPYGGLAAARQQFAAHRAERNAFIDNLVDADLKRGITLTFRAPNPVIRVGESILQLCHHGSHHRAQANNMLRHLGQRPVGLDVLDWMRSQR